MAEQSTSQVSVFDASRRLENGTCTDDTAATERERPATGTLSEDGLKHFKTYKYSSVDLSPISNHILRHYV